MLYPLVNVYMHNCGKSPFLMGKSTISMAIFNSKLLVYQRVTTKNYPTVQLCQFSWIQVLALVNDVRRPFLMLRGQGPNLLWATKIIGEWRRFNADLVV